MGTRIDPQGHHPVYTSVADLSGRQRRDQEELVNKQVDIRDKDY